MSCYIFGTPCYGTMALCSATEQYIACPDFTDDGTIEPFIDSLVDGILVFFMFLGFFLPLSCWHRG